MSALTIFSDQDPSAPVWESRDGDAIATELNKIDVRFERWQADRDLGENPQPQDVIAAYQHEIDKLVAEKGYQSWDVISMRPDNEQRVFVEGAGLFCLHLNGKIYQILCEKNDLISVPANTRHWFDMGGSPSFTAIRLFDNVEGWVAHFTGDKIADEYPRLGE